MLWPFGIENNEESAYSRLHPILQKTLEAVKNEYRAWPWGLDVCDKRYLSVESFWMCLEEEKDAT